MRPLARVDVAPAQRRRLADPQAGVDQRGNQRAAAGRACFGLGVELGGGVDPTWSRCESSDSGDALRPATADDPAIRAVALVAA
jgi:hypothetical protein